MFSFNKYLYLAVGLLLILFPLSLAHAQEESLESQFALGRVTGPGVGYYSASFTSVYSFASLLNHYYGQTGKENQGQLGVRGLMAFFSLERGIGCEVISEQRDP